MPRTKKDGKHINLYIDRILAERLEQYATENRQTVTAALEGLLAESLNRCETKSKAVADKLG